MLLWMVLIYIGILTFSYWSGIIQKIWKVLLPFLFGFLIAYILYPFVRKLENLGLKKVFSIIIVLFFVVLLLSGTVYLIVPVIYEQLILFSKLIPDVINQISIRFSIDLNSLETVFFEMLNPILSSFSSLFSSTLDIVSRSIKLFTDVIIIVVVSIYFLVDMDKIRKKIKLFFESFSSRFFNYLYDLDKEISNYFSGLMLLIIIQFFEYSIIFFIVGHPNWLLLGILASVTTVIPYFGGIITNIIAVITASVVSVPLFISTLVIILIFPNIDGYLISPKVYEKTNNINPVLAILSLGIFSGFLGVLGVVMSLPLYLALRCTWNHFIKDRINVWFICRCLR